MYLANNSKYFSPEKLPYIREKLMNLDEKKWASVTALTFKDPTIALIISVLGGSLGIDRFFLGDTGLGILKLITCGGGGIWTIIDWFLVTGKTKALNDQKLNDFLL